MAAQEEWDTGREGVPEAAVLSRWQRSFSAEALDGENSHAENYAEIQSRALATPCRQGGVICTGPA